MRNFGFSINEAGERFVSTEHTERTENTMNKVLQFETKPKPAVMRCEACFAETEAACGCGVAYLPAGVLAARAVAASPEKSVREIAKETGVGKSTVGRARKAAVPNGTPPDESKGADATTENDEPEPYCHSQEWFDKALREMKRGLRSYSRDMKKSQKLAFYREIIRWITAEHKMRTPQHIRFYQDLIADLSAITAKEIDWDATTD
jgi:hypothetical protein